MDFTSDKFASGTDFLQVVTQAAEPIDLTSAAYLSESNQGEKEGLVEMEEYKIDPNNVEAFSGGMHFLSMMHMVSGGRGKSVASILFRGRNPKP